MENLVLCLRFASHISPLLVVLLGVRYRGWLWGCALAAFCSDSLMLVLQLRHLPDDWVANLFVVVEFALFSAYYLRALAAAAITPAAIALAALYIVYTLWRGLGTLNLEGAGVLHLVYIVFLLVGFRRLLLSLPIIPLSKSSLFWANCALLLYVSSACLYFLYYKELSEMAREHRLAWKAFFLSTNILKYVLLTLAVRAQSRQVWRKSA